MVSLNLVAAIAAIFVQACLAPIPEVSAAKVLLTYFASNIILLAYLVASHSSPILTYISLNTIFILATTLLIATQRLYLSPLSRFPGPKHYALTNIVIAHNYFTGRGAYALVALHKKYGDIVRTGPNELSIIDVDAVEKVFKGKYPRGTYYEVGTLSGELNLNTVRDYKLHTPWRRIWEKAFASKEFGEYNPRVEMHVKRLLDVIRRTEGKDTNVTRMMDNLVFDIMSDLSFAYDSNMQEGKGDGFYMDFIHNFVAIVGMVGSLRPLCQLLPYLPKTSEVLEFRRRGEELLVARQKVGSNRKDVFRHLLAEDTETDLKFTQGQLRSNADLVIIAGADTTSSTMTQLFRILAKDERVQNKLREEVDGIVAEGKVLSAETTKALPYLNAVVNEALRLFNPVPTGVHAQAPPSGLTISGTYIPGNVQILIPHQGIMTDERYFPNGLEFIPERWTDEWREGVRDKRAYTPFGYGVHSCVGKQLALNEMRLAISAVVSSFNIVVGETYDEVRWREEMKDYAILKIGELWLRFVPR